MVSGPRDSDSMLCALDVGADAAARRSRMFSPVTTLCRTVQLDLQALLYPLRAKLAVRSVHAFGEAFLS